MTANLILIYGVLVLLGGVMGYVKAKSLPSITMGALSGVLIIVSALMMLSGQALGTYLALVLSISLLVLFSVRLKRTGKTMPAVPMLVLSILAAIVLIVDLAV